MNSRTLRCLNCVRPLGDRAHEPYFPFCGERCKLIDLGHWLGEDYRLPGQTGEVDPETMALLTGDRSPSEKG